MVRCPLLDEIWGCMPRKYCKSCCRKIFWFTEYHEEICYVFSISDTEITVDGRKFVIMPSKSGNFEEVQNICKHKGLQLFEPRNEATYEAVYKAAMEARLDNIWVNIKRPTSKEP